MRIFLHFSVRNKVLQPFVSSDIKMFHEVIFGELFLLHHNCFMFNNKLAEKA